MKTLAANTTYLMPFVLHDLEVTSWPSMHKTTEGEYGQNVWSVNYFSVGHIWYFITGSFGIRLGFSIYYRLALCLYNVMEWDAMSCDSVQSMCQVEWHVACPLRIVTLSKLDKLQFKDVYCITHIPQSLSRQRNTDIYL